MIPRLLLATLAVAGILLPAGLPPGAPAAAQEAREPLPLPPGPAMPKARPGADMPAARGDDAATAGAAGADGRDLGGETGGDLGHDPGGAADGTSPVRAQLRSYRFTTLAAGIPARIDSFAFLEGQRVAEGETVIAFDCSTERAERRAAAARADAARAAMRADAALVRRGGAGQVKADLSRAEYAAAVAELEGLDTMLEKCSIAAPFDALITAKAAQQSQFVNAGEPVVELVDTGALEVDMVVPSPWLAWLAPGHAFSIAVDETGDRLDGRVDRLGGTVDPVSQTVRVIGRLASHPPGLLPGMSGLLRFARADTAGAAAADDGGKAK
ncbi:efflux RND transporter periplasmic adaptor subunit [Marinibaculum pumilum]|uniref:Efflux RND transporter periplasmic adaptor subunit n=1 Tax=Marinibaculum pumilum TaxID=1766165 RepID=A0ABV7L1F4_9PROT